MSINGAVEACRQSNPVLSEVVGAGVTVGACTLAAIACGPVGAAGGAIYGCFSYLVGRPVEHIAMKVFNTDKDTASGLSKLVSAIAAFFASAAAAWAISGAVGIAMSFTAALILSAATAGIALGIIIGVIILIYIAKRISS